MRDTQAMVAAHGLRKSFGATTVLDGVDLDVERGTVFALLGPNGAGKTTTIRILATLLAPDAGSATVACHDVLREPGEVRRRISLTGQFAAVDGTLTGEENLRLMGRLCHLGRGGSRHRAAELLEAFDLVAAASAVLTAPGYRAAAARLQAEIAALPTAADAVALLEALHARVA